MVVEMHAFNITSEDEKKVFISYNLFYYRLAALLYPRDLEGGPPLEVDGS